MRPIITLLILCLTVNYTLGQKKRYLVWLSDKNQPTYSLSEPETFLSPRALERRINRGIAIDSLDLPVNSLYIDSLMHMGFRIMCTSRWLNTVTVETDSFELAEKLNEISFVDSVQITWKSPGLKSAKIPFETEQPFSFSYGNSFTQVAIHNGQKMHERGFTGKNKLIAVLDAGFYKVNELKAFDSLWVNNQIIDTKDFVNDGTPFYNTHEHGMMVLSTMGGQIPNTLIGTAPHASYVLIRTEDVASEYPVEMDFWIAGAEYADSIGADIINSSLGYSTFDDITMNYTTDQLDGKTYRVTIGAEIAASRGLLIFNSAGNEGNKAWKKIIGPADAPNVLAIGSVNKDSTYTSFSSLGFSADGRVKPDIMANGSQTALQGTNNFPATANGTSFASPLMAGLGACLWQALPDKSAAEMRDLLRKSGDRYHNPTPQFGYGIPDIFGAYSFETGIYTKLEEKTPFLYPNPINYNQLQIHFHSSNIPYTVAIYNLSGMLMEIQKGKTEPVTSVSLRRPLKTGLYLLSVTTDNKKFTLKFQVK
jgi:serine protease AprX